MSYKQNKTLHYIYFRVKNTSYGILESFIKTSLIKNEKTIEFFGIMGFKKLCNIDLRFKLFACIFDKKKKRFNFSVLMHFFTKLISSLRNYTSLEYSIYFFQFFFLRFNNTIITPILLVCLFTNYFYILFPYSLLPNVSSYLYNTASFLFLIIKFKHLLFYYKLLNVKQKTIFTKIFFCFLEKNINNLFKKNNILQKIRILRNYLKIISIKEFFTLESLKICIHKDLLLKPLLLLPIFDTYSEKSLKKKKKTLLINLNFYIIFTKSQNINQVKFKKSKSHRKLLQNRFTNLLMFKKAYIFKILILAMVQNFTFLMFCYDLKLKKYEILNLSIIYNLIYLHKRSLDWESNLYSTFCSNSIIINDKKLSILGLTQKYYKTLYLVKYSINYLKKKYVYEKTFNYYRFLLIYKKKALFYNDNYLSNFLKII